MDHTKIVRTGIVQFDIKMGDISSNLAFTIDGIKRLAAKEVQLAVLPELWSCGFDPSGMKRHAEKTPDILDKLSRLAGKHRMMIAGSLPEVHEDIVYNTLYLVDEKGRVSGKYRKIHLFPLLDEDACFQPGNRAAVCQTSLGIFGLMICYDLRFPEVCRSLALQGAQMVLVSAQWPAQRIDHWNILLRARAIENQIFIIACNRCGRDGELIFNGHSQIISPYGTVLAKADDGNSELIAEINLNDIDSFRDQFDCLAQRRPDSYHS